LLLIGLLFTLALFLAIGTIYHLSWLLMLSITVTLILVVAVILRKRALEGITYERRWHYRRGFPGETSEVKLVTENKKRSPVFWLKVSDKWPLATPPQDVSTLSISHIAGEGLLNNLYNLKGKEKLVREIPFRFDARGVHPVGPATLESGDIFGLFIKSEEQAVREYVTVFPSLIKLPTQKIKTEDPFGERKSEHPIFEDPLRIMGVRPYQPGDGFRRIHWSATARTGQLQARMFEAVSAHVLIVVLNASPETDIDVGLEPDLLEHLTSVAATIIYQACNARYSVGLMSNGCMAHADQPFYLLPGRSSDQLGNLLSALAAVTDITSLPFDRFLAKYAPQIPFGASMVIVTPYINNMMAETLLSIRKHSHKTTLFSLSKQKALKIPGIHIIHVPSIRAT
jgi:uncharacterized protein (DUF58 family)